MDIVALWIAMLGTILAFWEIQPPRGDALGSLSALGLVRSGSELRDLEAEHVNRHGGRGGSMNEPLDGDLLRRVLAGLPEFILIVDRDRMIRYINRVEPGYDANDVVGRRSTDVLFPESRAVLDEAMDRVFVQGEAAPYEVRAQHPDGSDSWYGGEVTPIREGGEIVGAVIRANNITELRSVQEELVQVKRLLRICAWCGRIQGEDGEWEDISSYLSSAGKTDVSHGLCGQCEHRQVSRGGGV